MPIKPTTTALAAALFPLLAKGRTDARGTKGKNGPYKQDLPLDHSALERHVSGGPPVGIYPIKPGESVCMIACLDLDNHQGKSTSEQMAEAASLICKEAARRGYRPHAWRSTGGKGIHIYFVWKATQDARSVRLELRSILQSCGFSDGDGGVSDKQVEVFPKQDRVALGAYGNFFYIPGAGKSEPLDPSSFAGLGRSAIVGYQWADSPAVPVADPAPERPNVSRADVDLEFVASAVAAIPNTAETNYNEWLSLITAIHWCDSGDRGHQIAEAWSEKSPKHTPERFEYCWDHFAPEREGAATVGSIFHRARLNGWIDPAIDAAMAALDDLPISECFEAMQNAPSLDPKVMAAGGALSINHGRPGLVTPLTEVGDCDILAQIVGDLVRYIPEENGFLIFTEGAWVRDDGNAHLTEAGKQVYPYRIREADALMDAGGHAKDVNSVHNYALKSQSGPALARMIDLLSKRPPMRQSVTMLDRDPLVVGFDGGRQIVDLRTGTTRAARPGDYVTKSLGVREVGVSSLATRWIDFLDEIFVGDAELVEWFRRFCGYVLTGLTREQILVFFFGQGRNGKSVLVRVMLDVLGAYGRSISSETLMQSKRDAQAASPELARLAGARLVSTQETEDGSRLAESLIKGMTGGDKIVARYLHKDLFEFDPQFKLVISGNHRPIIRGQDHGIWRRMRLIPFSATFSDANDDKGLDAKLAAERPHIAAWMVEAATDYLRDGLGPVPRRVAEATEEYKKQMDTIGEWMAECCEQSDPNAETAVADLFTSYYYWSKAAGLALPNKLGFGRRMAERPGLVFKHDGKKGRRYAGIRISQHAAATYQSVPTIEVVLDEAF